MEQKADQSLIQNAVWRVQLRVGFVRIEVDDPYCRTDVVTSYGRFRAAATTASMTEVTARSSRPSTTQKSACARKRRQLPASFTLGTDANLKLPSFLCSRASTRAQG